MDRLDCGCTNEQHQHDTYMCLCGASSTNCARDAHDQARRNCFAPGQHEPNCDRLLRFRARKNPAAALTRYKPKAWPRSRALEFSPIHACGGCHKSITPYVMPARVVLLPHGSTVADEIRNVQPFCSVKCLRDWCDRILEVG
jgi:hypothetical protein